MTPQTYATYSGVGSIISGIGSAYAQSQQYKIQQIQAKTRANIAKMQGKQESLSMLRMFNKGMASNAVMAAAQGRSGGSVEAIAQASEQQYNWDINTVELNAELQARGYQSQAAQYGAASSQAMVGGSLGAVSGGLMDMGTSLYKIGG